MEPKVLRIPAEVDTLHEVLAFVDSLLEENVRSAGSGSL